MAGLRVTEVGSCVCTRHECVRPNGIGDLQNGERYVTFLRCYIVLTPDQICEHGLDCYMRPPWLLSLMAHHFLRYLVSVEENAGEEDGKNARRHASTARQD
jgi:hypothetical protein